MKTVAFNLSWAMAPAAKTTVSATPAAPASTILPPCLCLSSFHIRRLPGWIDVAAGAPLQASLPLAHPIPSDAHPRGNIKRGERVYLGSLHKIADRLVLSLRRIEALAAGPQPACKAIVHGRNLISVHVRGVRVAVDATKFRLGSQNLDAG